MKPKLRKAALSPECSFIVRKDVGINMKNYWQYHPEYEIICIKKSAGIWIIGDYIGNFRSGDIIILGPNVPHSLRHDSKYIMEKGGTKGEAIIALFNKDILGASFLTLPEAKEIQDILTLARRGMKVTGEAKKIILPIMEDMLSCRPGRRLVNLLSVLQTVAEDNQYDILLSNGFFYVPNEFDDKRIDTIFDYTFNNYDRDIAIEDVASLVNMTRYSFCRYFKEITNKTYIQFLMGVRIGKACRLLVEKNMNVSEVCFSCGYNSLSHFIHQFKAIKNCSPSSYKRKYVKYLTRV